MRTIRSFVPLILFSLGISVSAMAEESIPSIPKFAEVSPGIYRGGRPDADGLEALVRLGVKVDLNLEDDAKAVAEETTAAESLGMTVIQKPMSGFWAPKDPEVAEILSLIADPGNYPIFVHCQHGEDRTGLIFGLYRVFHDGYTPADAYQEMLTNGFHSELYFLNHYFEMKTGFED